MGMHRRNSALDYRKKNRRKIYKTLLQLALLMVVGYSLFHVLVDTESYRMPDEKEWSNRQGFIALSYFGVSRTGTPKLIDKSQLDQQLQALKDQGYETVSQQDILNFYHNGTALPDKALFLSFEDGRNDSSLYAQPLLEKYNYKATFLSYADKVGSGDRKFLQPGDMRKMMKTGYWEMGSNGYRLSYINIFNRDGTFLGMKDENDLHNKDKVEYYNHYLMDFIRDENMIPVEDRAEMETRIGTDYKAMRTIYDDKLGFVPNVYMIMHANALNEGMNRLVSDANNANIKQIFKLHYNREGTAFNEAGADPFDLTRVQPAPYWYTNHLLMKLRKDTGQAMKFVIGDKERAKDWRVISGAAQFIDNRIALTSLPSGNGMMYLDPSDAYTDMTLTANLSGNVIGKQSVYVRFDRNKDSYLRVSLIDNELIVDEKRPGRVATRLFTRKLGEVDWKESDLALNKATVYSIEQTASGNSENQSEVDYPTNVKNTRELGVTVTGNALTIKVDGELQLEERQIDSSINAGGVALESGFSEMNHKDDIYDGVFDDIRIESIRTDGERNTVLYQNSFEGLDKIVSRVKNAFDSTIDWMIDTF
ncbi:polysaccharide deacetylase family protein [Cohnella lupini]|uniref:Polysaccharide deacetylase n=1 Tax=Cohnella lupini TaxID=1294267 RepID=A0A3D9IKG5_9BACL|nr:polysaccharide deacetylase family protein [Cohnella lupini]RED61596.1 polysaccharide deacetylase [Cohnella lupini]